MIAESRVAYRAVTDTVRQECRGLSTTAVDFILIPLIPFVPLVPLLPLIHLVPLIPLVPVIPLIPLFPPLVYCGGPITSFSDWGI